MLTQLSLPADNLSLPPCSQADYCLRAACTHVLRDMIDMIVVTSLQSPGRICGNAIKQLEAIALE